MDARTTAALVRGIIDDCHDYLLRRFGHAPGTGRLMNLVEMRCENGHEWLWDLDITVTPPPCSIYVEGINKERHVCGLPYRPVKVPTISNIVSPDAPTTTNERGGKQSHVPVRFDLIDGKAMFAMAAVLHEGAEKYAAGNWRLIPERDHLNHALMHIFAYLSGDRTDDHLSHALCRITFANAVELDPEAGPERDE